MSVQNVCPPLPPPFWSPRGFFIIGPRWDLLGLEAGPGLQSVVEGVSGALGGGDIAMSFQDVSRLDVTLGDSTTNEILGGILGGGGGIRA